MEKEYDGIIIGAGHNGMICAGYLAQAGLKILVLSRPPEICGCAPEPIEAMATCPMPLESVSKPRITDRNANIPRTVSFSNSCEIVSLIE